MTKTAPDTGYWTPVTGHRLLDTGYGTLVPVGLVSRDGLKEDGSRTIHPAALESPTMGELELEPELLKQR